MGCDQGHEHDPDCEEWRQAVLAEMAEDYVKARFERPEVAKGIRLAMGRIGDEEETHELISAKRAELGIKVRVVRVPRDQSP